MRDSQRWAESVFGDAELGDARRSRRLVELAAEAAARPSGVVMATCATSASREGAFRFLENGAVTPDGIRESMCRSTARASRSERTVIVPVDATSIHLTDRGRKRGIGAIGTWTKGAQGVHVMTALALTSEGAAIGIAAQQMWVRKNRSKYGRAGALGQPSENQAWLDVVESAVGTLKDEAPDCLPWFQLDRGADCFEVLDLATKQGLLLTVRSAYDRRIEGSSSKLWETLRGKPVIAKKKIDVSRRPPMQRQKRVNGKRVQFMTKPRAARKATVAIRAAPVTLDCRPQNGYLHTTIELNAVYVRETHRPAKDCIEWMLLTTHPIRTRADVLKVVHGYALRWRIEEFHRLWKTGLCNVEATQLRSRNAIFKWSTILAAVATRAMRLTQLARTTPDVLATTEFSRAELAAIIALRKPKGIADDHVPTLSVAVIWVAELGGFSVYKGNPGAITIGRGLYDVLVVARAFENREQKR